METQVQQDTHSTAIPLLRGAAILAVIATHVFSSLPPGIYTVQPINNIFIALDQVMRFCVPLFVALSGYSLAKKYYHHPFELMTFFKRRIWKLLPLYLLWSFFLMVMLQTIPQWRTIGSHLSVIVMLLLGQADYQLYFVPLIFQLYLLFPLLWLITQFMPNVMLVSAMLLQAATISVLAQPMLIRTEWFQMLTDQAQYVIFSSWIGYFALGIWLATLINANIFNRPVMAKIRYVAIRLGLLLMIGGLSWAIWQAITAVDSGIDPLLALRFTRFPIMTYSLGLVVIAITQAEKLHRLPQLFHKILILLGRNSYTLFLSHTLILRIVFSTGLPGTRVQLPLGVFILVIVVTGFVFWISEKVKKWLGLNE